MNTVRIFKYEWMWLPFRLFSPTAYVVIVGLPLACAGRRLCNTDQLRPLDLGRWWLVMSMSLYPMECRRLLDLQPLGQVTLWGCCMGSKCRRNGLKRLSIKGDMSGHASLKEREKNGERLVTDVSTSPGLKKWSSHKENTHFTRFVPFCIFVI